MSRSAGILLILVSLAAFAQDPDPVYPVGKGVTPPTLLHKVDPTFTQVARAEMIQGTALYSLIVDRNGKPRDIEVISPMGYGLDEGGHDALAKWIFKPGEKDGVPVSIRAVVQVNFRLTNVPFDEKREKQRTLFNTAIHDINTPASKPKGIEEVEKLSADKFLPAMSLVGRWMVDGQFVPKDLAGGTELIRKAADKNDSGGMYDLGVMYIKGIGMTADPEKGLKLIRDASFRGSRAAQLYLGVKYQTGDGLPAADPARASQYFRLCAAVGVAQCQFHLGEYLARPGGGGDAVQAVAWLELAREGAVAQAEALLTSVKNTLSADEIQRAEKLKAQLVRE